MHPRSVNVYPPAGSLKSTVGAANVIAAVGIRALTWPTVTGEANPRIANAVAVAGSGGVNSTTPS